jgi:hypothetical protein
MTNEQCLRTQGLPLTGWFYGDVADLGDAFGHHDPHPCQVCGYEPLRFLHYLEHDDAEGVEVGCECAAKMVRPGLDPREFETVLRNRASRRARWLKRVWNESWNGSLYLYLDGHNIGVKPDGDRWEWWIGRQPSMGTYPTRERAQLALFDSLYASKIRPEEKRRKN